MDGSMQDRQPWPVPQAQTPQVSLHAAGQQPARAPFLAERRGTGADASQPAPPTGAPVPGAAPASFAPQAPAAPAAAPQGSFSPQPAASFTPQQPASFAPRAPAAAPSSPAQAFEQAAQAQLGQQSFSPAPAQQQAPAAPEAPAQPAAPARQAAPATSAGGNRIGMASQREDSDLDLQLALREMMRLGASDLHITTGAPPMIRLDGGLTPIPNMERLTPASIQRSLYSILTQKQREIFEEHLELDFSYALVGEGRFRVNLYQQRDSLGAAFRVIPYEIKALEALGVPPAVGSLAGKHRGLVLVTGPTGSGKSTTLASLIDLVNRNRAAHIMTVEDPIEFLHKHKKSLINQREVGADTHSFGNALKHVLRQDPDVILVGEMRDLETISVALTAAETGHLVFATLHTQDAAQTIDRIIDVFPSEQQGQVRTQLATAIQGVVCQALAKRADGAGRAVATEVMIATPAIRNLIREGKTHQIYSMMQSGSRQGMHTMDQHLAELVRSGRISYESGLELCHHYEDFNRLCGRTGADAQGGQH
ncbi:type IV pilus twitching motility protein PilT [Demequina gelatinilytica]|uniref:type IV pilus twitching motility protein PilT n=1 Tax=Demequina gelatinilytica TaxID=1638980 RepID=UPI000AFCB3C6|nr:type IV pilus twitching motility protein PilT [Demequina gelatinilytica]